MPYDLREFIFGDIIVVFIGSLNADFEEEKHNIRNWQQLHNATGRRVLPRGGIPSWRD